MSQARGNRVMDVPAFLLHSYPYRETSLILDVFTRAHGRVALVAKGAKRPHSALRPVLVSFQRLALSWSGAGEIKTLVRAEWAGALQRLEGAGAMSGWYLNELLMHLLPREDPHEGLYDAYAAALASLCEDRPRQPILRYFEWRLLCEIGYGFELAAERFEDPGYEPELRRLLRERLDYHMSGRPLATRQVLRDLQDYLP